MIPVLPITASFVRLPAGEVYRLALASISDIQTRRQKIVREQVNKALETEDTSFMGLVRTKRYADRTEAMEHSGRVHAAKQLMVGAEEVCNEMRDLARYLMDSPALKDEDKYINLTLADYRALK